MKIKKTQPLVSFILPVYNAELFLQETIHSIIEQTYSNFELIAIDDGSTDGSLAILKRYEKIDDRIKVYSRENRGLVATLNQAIELASGELLARIDADDLCVPKRLEWQVAAMMKNTDAALCCGFFEMLSEDGEFLHKQIVPTHTEDLLRLIYTRNPIAHASVMLRKALLPLDPYNPNVGPTEDFELWTKLATKHQLICVPHVIMRYRINTSGIMHTIGTQQWKYIHNHFNYFWEKRGLPEIRNPRALRHNMHAYLDENTTTPYGSALVQLFYEGEAHAAIKCIKRGYPWHGFKMLLYVAVSSRTGLRAAYKRVALIVAGKKQTIPFWRQKSDEVELE